MEKEFSQQRNGTGTREWSENSADFQLGCSHDCLYCYARDMALRFGQIKSRDEWLNEKIRSWSVHGRWAKRTGVIMFPTTHDITPHNIDTAVIFLANILEAGNKVLLVSKPNLKCIETICQTFAGFKDQILFRFTISTTDDTISKFWEPGAPLPGERIEALKTARSFGYPTSVSMEPMLGGTDMAIQTYYAIIPYVEETVWIGKMNWDRIREESTPEILRAIQEIRHLQRDAEILRLVDVLQDQPKVRWKYSIKQVIKSHKECSQL